MADRTKLAFLIAGGLLMFAGIAVVPVGAALSRTHAPIAGWLIADGLIAFIIGVAAIVYGGFLPLMAPSSASAALASSEAAVYPLLLEGRRDATLSRWLWLVKWLLAIPHVVVLFFLGIAFVILTAVAFFAILFTERYPQPLFETNAGILRWGWRVAFYAYSALGTDRYPPFTLQDVDYPANLVVSYPERLSRGLALVKWWLLALPHYVIVGIFSAGASWSGGSSSGNEASGWHASGGLLPVLVFFAAVSLLVIGRYPAGIFDFVVGLNRWMYRVIAYVALMRDEYPPFRLDLGGSEPRSSY